MKKIVLSLSLLMSMYAFAQKKNGLEKIIVEKYYISNAADAAKSDEESTDATYPTGALPVGSITYRIYADLLPGYKMKSVYADGTRNQNLIFKTSTSFYNHPSGMVSPSTIKKTGATGIQANPLLALDSYLTLGAAASGFYGIPKEDDNTTANFFSASNPGGVLLNENEAVIGKPLTEKDGFFVGTGIAVPSFLGVPDEVNDVFSDGSVVGNSAEVLDGAYFATAPARGADSLTNKVLIAQLTTNGKLEFHLNVVVQIGAEDQEYYVARNPFTGPGDTNPTPDVVISSLNYPDSTVTDIETPTIKTYNDVFFSVYPNPTNGNVTLDIPAAEPNSKGNYTIYGVIGNVIAHKELNAITSNYKEVIDMSLLAKGLYTIQLNVNGAISTKKIIKN